MSENSYSMCFWAQSTVDHRLTGARMDQLAIFRLFHAVHGIVPWTDHDLMALVWADRDRTIEIRSKPDQICCARSDDPGESRSWSNGPDRSWVLLGLDFILKYYFWVFGIYITPIDKPFIALKSWRCFGGVERLLERFQIAFVRVLELFIERFLYKGWVVSFSCIVWFFLS